jgi:putative membrane protein
MSRKLKKFLSAQDRHAIENAVREAEAKTSGEIVPVVTARSSHYDWIGYRASLIGWAAASLLILWAHFFRPFMLEFWEAEALQVTGLVAGWLLSRFSFGIRLLVPDVVLEEEVDHAAAASFMRNGLSNTRDRTGVLIFVSLRERRVRILADKGIHDHVGENFWNQEVDRIVASIQEGSPARGMTEAIRSIGDRLSKHFPPRPDGKNELPDRVRSE